MEPEEGAFQSVKGQDWARSPNKKSFRKEAFSLVELPGVEPGSGEETNGAFYMLSGTCCREKYGLPPPELFLMPLLRQQAGATPVEYPTLSTASGWISCQIDLSETVGVSVIYPD